MLVHPIFGPLTENVLHLPLGKGALSTEKPQKLQIFTKFSGFSPLWGHLASSIQHQLIH